MRKLIQKLVQLLLPLIQLPPATKVDPEQGHDTIDDQKPILATRKGLRQFIKQLMLMLAIGCSGVGDVVQNLVRVCAKTLGDVGNALGSERAFGVDVGYLAAGSAHFFWELRGHAHGVAELGLSAACEYQYGPLRMQGESYGTRQRPVMVSSVCNLRAVESYLTDALRLKAAVKM